MSGHADAGRVDGLSVVEHDHLPYDALYAAGPHLIVGEAAHLRWRLWLHEQRADARGEARAIVRAGLADLMPGLSDEPAYLATVNDRRT